MRIQLTNKAAADKYIAFAKAEFADVAEKVFFFWKQVDEDTFEAEINCYRCGGTGYIQAFRHVEAGVCFACENIMPRRILRVDYIGFAKKVREQVNKEKKRQKKEGERVRKAQERQAAFEKNARELEGGELLIAEWAKGDESEDCFISSLAGALYRFGSLSERQQAALAKNWAKAQAKVAREAKWARENEERLAKLANVPFPVGRVAVEAEVMSVKEYDGEWGTVLKCLLQTAEGHRFFGTVPKAILKTVNADELKGKTIAFTAAFEEKEPGFGTYKRPTKAKVIG